MNDWEKRLDRELKALPGLKAPASLSPRVLAAVAKKQRHWRTWAQRRQGVFVLGVAAAAAAALRAAQEALKALAPLLEPAFAWAAAAQRHAALAFGAVRTIWWAERLPWGAAVALLYLLCVALGAMLCQVAASPGHARA